MVLVALDSFPGNIKMLNAIVLGRNVEDMFCRGRIYNLMAKKHYENTSSMGAFTVCVFFTTRSLNSGSSLDLRSIAPLIYSLFSGEQKPCLALISGDAHPDRIFYVYI